MSPCESLHVRSCCRSMCFAPSPLHCSIRVFFPHRKKVLRRSLRDFPIREESSSSAGCTSINHEELLPHLLDLDDSSLRGYASQKENRVSLEFLLWLKDRESRAGGRERAELNSLGGKLTAIKEGLDPITANELVSSMRGHGRQEEAMEHGAAEGDSSVELQIQQRKAELARRMALDSVSPAQLTLDQSKARDFTEALREQRATSTAALIGRAPVEMAQAQKGLDAASAADRILEALLSIEDKSERLAMVPEAFVPPPQDTSLEDSASGEELVYTSPLRLLQAVSLAVQRLEGDKTNKTPDIEQFLIHNVTFLSPQERKSALLDIKRAIFAVLESEDK